MPDWLVTSLHTSLCAGIRPSVMISNSEIIVQFIHIGLESRSREFIDDAAMFHDVVPVGHGRGEVHILLDKKTQNARRVERADSMPDLLNDDRCQAFGGLNEQQQPGANAQNAG